ncbi:MAG: PLP-dependent aminotransferase family protein [Alteromonadaceae bacterium]|nr:PLP-dependent aminotransferase family protein [Alteromonadaceae bacterium]
MDPDLSLPLNITLSKSEKRVEGLTRQLREAIVTGRLVANMALPSSRQLASQLNVSRNTVLSAYDRLTSQGFLFARKGAGTFVSPNVTTPQLKSVSKVSPTRVSVVEHWSHRRLSDMLLDQPRSDIDFRIGYPETRYFPFSDWRRCLARAQRQEEKDGMNDANPQGFRPLRIALTGILSRNRAIACQDDELIVTQGTQHSLTLIATILVKVGITRIAMESPGYPMAKYLFEAAGAHVIDVPIDKHGICVDQIPQNIDCVYVTPSHQFPMGMPLSLERRAALLCLAKERGMVVIEDDYDSEIQLSRTPMDAMKTMDNHGSVFYLGTFSKVMYPGVRTGFILAPAWAKEALITVRFLHSWCNPIVIQRALADFIICGHLRRHIAAMSRRYRLRHKILFQAMQKQSTWFTAVSVRAGVHATYLVDPSVCASTLSEHAAQVGIGVRALSQFTEPRLSSDIPVPNALAFGLGCVNSKDISNAVFKLADIAQQIAKK